MSLKYGLEWVNKDNNWVVDKIEIPLFVYFLDVNDIEIRRTRMPVTLDQAFCMRKKDKAEFKLILDPPKFATNVYVRFGASDLKTRWHRIQESAKSP